MMIATRLRPNESHARPPSHRRGRPFAPAVRSPRSFTLMQSLTGRGYIVLPAFSLRSLKRVSIFPHALSPERARNARAFVRLPNA